MVLGASVHVDYRLPGEVPGGWFTTRDLSSAFDDFRIAADGRLLRCTFRPVAGGGDPSGSLLGIGGILAHAKLRPSEEEPCDYDGFLGLRNTCRRFTARLRGGTVVDMRAGGLEAYAVPGGGPACALAILVEAFSVGRSPDPAEVSDFLAAHGSA